MFHSTKKPVTTMLTYPWKCTVLHCNHLGNTWKPLVLMIRHFDYCLSASEGDNQSVGSSAPVVSRCFPGGYNVKLYISRGRLPWWLLAFLHSVQCIWPSASLTHYRLLFGSQCCPTAASLISWATSVEGTGLCSCSMWPWTIIIIFIFTVAYLVRTSHFLGFIRWLGYGTLCYS